MSASALERLRAATREREAIRRSWDATRNTELLSLLVLLVPRLLRAERCGVFIASPGRGEVWLVAGTGVVERQIVVDAERSMVGEVIRSGAPLLRGDLAVTEGAHQEVASSLYFEVRDAIAVPIRSRTEDRVIGALQVLNRQDNTPFGEADAALLSEVVFTAQSTFERIYNSQTLLEKADALDARINHLDQMESAVRGGRMFRTFEPTEERPRGGFLHHRWRGTCYPPFIDVGATRALSESWDTDENDVFLATHQKVGTHLAKKFLSLLAQELLDLPAGHPYLTGDIGHDTIPWPEVMYSQHGRACWDQYRARTAGHTRFWYIHCSFDDLPFRSIHPKTRFVVVGRDPRAVAVSQYFFWKRHPLLRVPPTTDLDDFVQYFIEGDLYFGDYHQHVLRWIQRPDRRVRRERVLFLTYEELVQEKLRAVRALGSFLAPEATLRDERARAIAAETEFSTMKSRLTKDPGSFHLDPKVYFRAGVPRDWMKHLSSEAVAAIDQKTREVWGEESLERPPIGRIDALTSGGIS